MVAFWKVCLNLELISEIHKIIQAQINILIDKAIYISFKREIYIDANKNY